MIEKPKRPTKISNQDNKQPQTIEQLIRRYDLDNTKIYDFLDELSITLNETQTVVSATEPIGNNRGQVWIQKGKNLYNPSRYPLFQGLWTEGEKIGFNDSGWYVVVPITGGLPYTISKTNNMIYCCTTASYPKGGIVQVDTWTGSGNVNQLIKETSPEAKYLFIGLLASSSATGTDKANAIAGLQVEQGRVATPYEAYVEPKVYLKNDNGVYEEFYKENETLLYSSSGSNGTITLNDAPTKYREIEIYYKNSGGTLSSSVKVCPSEVAGIDCTLLVYDTNGTIYFVLAKLTISNSQLVPSQYGQTSFTTANVNKTDVTTNPIYVYKVVGRN